MLGDSAWKFRARLSVRYGEMIEIKSRLIVEPDRRNLPACFVFRWRELRDVQSSYVSLMVLKKDIVVEMEERRRQPFASARRFPV
ncbi:hypothetical protein PM082_022473 [Marasmius tenuissimus]|nr:hypothetical protein PM082_022473 [Marasmius tenuissimus]